MRQVREKGRGVGHLNKAPKLHHLPLAPWTRMFCPIVRGLFGLLWRRISEKEVARVQRAYVCVLAHASLLAF